MRLDPTPTIEGNDGPIYMVVTELGPDTIMINEVDKVSKMIVMTSSLSLVFDDSTDDDNKKIKELIQVSHEVAPSVPPPFKSTTATKQTKICYVVSRCGIVQSIPHIVLFSVGRNKICASTSCDSSLRGVP